MLGYPVFLFVLEKILKYKDNIKNMEYEPTVTIMVVAHNEEKVIRTKLENLIGLNYPTEKISIAIASDFCTDRTNQIVEEFIKSHPDRDIWIHKSEKHLGKTNAQNETQKLVKSEILVMTDANAILDNNAVRELVSSFTHDDIVYVTGQLKYVNERKSSTAASEGFYWKVDLKCRDIESKIQTITAGNGALYAVRNCEYIEIAPIECHDSSFPLLYALRKQRAIYNKEAIAYEKAGEVDQDEFKRKVRMNRKILKEILPNIKILNVFKYHWISIFYLGHRTCRYLLWLAHCAVLLSNIALACSEGGIWKIILELQIVFYGIAILGWKTESENRIIKIIYYYTLTIVAQWFGVIREIFGKSKAVWDKAESTR